MIVFNRFAHILFLTLLLKSVSFLFSLQDKHNIWELAEDKTQEGFRRNAKQGNVRCRGLYKQIPGLTTSPCV